MLTHRHWLYTFRGYPVSYLSSIVDEIQSKLEATTCESLLLLRTELMDSARQVPEGMCKCNACVQFLKVHLNCTCLNIINSLVGFADMIFLYQCAAMTLRLVQSNQLKLAHNSWVLHSLPLNHSWDPNSESMLRLHEWNKRSAQLYSQSTSAVVQQVKPPLTHE